MEMLMVMEKMLSVIEVDLVPLKRTSVLLLLSLRKWKQAQQKDGAGYLRCNSGIESSEYDQQVEDEVATETPLETWRGVGYQALELNKLCTTTVI